MPILTAVVVPGAVVVVQHEVEHGHALRGIVERAERDGQVAPRHRHRRFHGRAGTVVEHGARRPIHRDRQPERVHAPVKLAGRGGLRHRDRDRVVLGGRDGEPRHTAPAGASSRTHPHMLDRRAAHVAVNVRRLHVVVEQRFGEAGDLRGVALGAVERQRVRPRGDVARRCRRSNSRPPRRPRRRTCHSTARKPAAHRPRRRGT